MPLLHDVTSSMAPSEVGCTFVAPSGYIAIPVKFSKEQKSQHCIFAKPQTVRETLDETLPANRTLYVMNVPSYLSEKALTRLFSNCGRVESVEFLNKTKSFEKPNSKYFHLKVPRGFKSAYIVFKNESAIQAVLTMNLQKPFIVEEDHSVKTGIHKWIEDYKESLIDVADLQAEVDQFMQEYDQRLEKKEEKAKEEEGVPDEEGWITVTRKGRRPGLARTEKINLRLLEKEKKKRAQKELLNFYAWQHRNSKKEHLAELRKKFEEDKQKIALMRAQRKFRPY